MTTLDAQRPTKFTSRSTTTPPYVPLSIAIVSPGETWDIASASVAATPGPGVAPLRTTIFAFEGGKGAVQSSTGWQFASPIAARVASPQADVGTMA
jgi:hypothetical protein